MLPEEVVAGVDLGGRKAAVSIYKDGVLMSVDHYEASAKLTRQMALHQVAEWVYKKLLPVDYVFIEEPLIGRGVRASMSVVQCAGAVMSRLAEHRVYLVPVSSWKMATHGKGNADKKAVQSWLKRVHPAYASLCGSNQDRFDATCIGLYGVQVVRKQALLADF